MNKWQLQLRNDDGLLWLVVLHDISLFIVRITNYHIRTVMKILLWMVFCAPLAAMGQSFGPVRADVVRVIDGDTFIADVAVWPGLTQRVRVRVLGVNTPENKGKVAECEKIAGDRASVFSREFLKNAGDVWLFDVKPDKYAGRVDARVVNNNGDLSEALIKSGHGRVYHGEKRGPWCEDINAATLSE